MVEKICIKEYTTRSGRSYRDFALSYEVFGRPLGNAPIVLVNHALTGNSTVSGASGWWKELIGSEKCVDTNVFSVLAFNVPGNGYDDFLIENYLDFSIYDIAKLFLIGVGTLQIDTLFAVIGGSLGGSIAWQMAVLDPNLIENIIPIATDWKATDWLLAQCRIQKELLEHSDRPVMSARMHAMTFYRSPQSFTQKFGRTVHKNLGVFNVESWLRHHGEKLQQRFQQKAYMLMNHLLMTNDITMGHNNIQETVKLIKGNIFLIGINTDWFYVNEEIKKTYTQLKEVKENVYYSQIDSMHGHDAFLIEYDQLSKILKDTFSVKNIQRNNYEYTNVIGYSHI